MDIIAAALPLIIGVRMAFSAMTIVMTILGLAISLLKTGARDHAVAKGVGQALGIGFLFLGHAFFWVGVGAKWSSHANGGRMVCLCHVFGDWAPSLLENSLTA